MWWDDVGQWVPPFWETSMDQLGTSVQAPTHGSTQQRGTAHLAAKDGDYRSLEGKIPNFIIKHSDLTFQNSDLMMIKNGN